MIKLEDKLYTSTEVASILGVSLRSVYRYIEEGKLTAEVKTATGRHRFTKQDILDFLYPDGQPASTSKEEKRSAPKEAEAPVKETPVEFSKEPEVSTKPSPEPAEDVDWLSKFRAAAEKFKQEEAEQTSSVVEEQEEVQEPEQEEEPSNMFYYRSSLGGLKDIAQGIDKSSKESSLDYAFTLNAGLSLHKPIKPFSLLHAYVRPGDLQYFEKLLSLTPSDEGNAQLCLITSDEGDIYTNKEVLHGLSVVAKSQLKEDISTMNASDLEDDIAAII